MSINTTERKYSYPDFAVVTQNKYREKPRNFSCVLPSFQFWKGSSSKEAMPEIKNIWISNSDKSRCAPQLSALVEIHYLKKWQVPVMYFMSYTSANITYPVNKT